MIAEGSQSSPRLQISTQVAKLNGWLSLEDISARLQHSGGETGHESVVFAAWLSIAVVPRQLTVDSRDFLAAGEEPGPAPAPAKTPCRRAATACVRAVKLLRPAASLPSLSSDSISRASAGRHG